MRQKEDKMLHKVVRLLQLHALRDWDEEDELGVVGNGRAIERVELEIAISDLSPLLLLS